MKNDNVLRPRKRLSKIRVLASTNSCEASVNEECLMISAPSSCRTASDSTTCDRISDSKAIVERPGRGSQPPGCGNSGTRDREAA